MNILHLFFNLLEPDYSNINWLSVRFARWKTNKHEKRNQQYKNYNTDEIFFDVPGAGSICMSRSCKNSTGRAFGFGFSVSWGRYGYRGGGVIDREEAKRMAEFILQKHSEITQEEKDAEQKELLERDKRLEKFYV